MSNLVWALDKQQAKQKYTQITLNGLPVPTHALPLLPTPDSLFATLVKNGFGQKVFGAAVAMLETSKLIKCFIK